MVVVGRYPGGGRATATLSGTTRSGQSVFAYPALFADGPAEGGDFVARFWAERRVGELVDQLDRLGGPGPDSREGAELVQEIVALAKRHGILTPYTSFLSLEEQSLTADGDLVRQTRENLSSLNKVSGASANSQRQWRSNVADSFSAPQAPAPSMMSFEASHEMKEMAADTDFAVAASSGRLIPPRQLAGRAFFLKDGRLLEGDLTEKELQSLKTVNKLSDEYFQLAKELGAEGGILLAQSEPIAFRHKGQAFLID
jgi:Ca-activated chloride channel family protein